MYPDISGKTCGYFSEDLFPTKWSFVIFIGYMVLFINQGILVTASKNKEGGFSYNPAVAVLLTECVKVSVALILFLKDEGLNKLIPDVIKHVKVLLLYFVPSALYCIYNNLAYTSLANFDPTTYFILLQFRVVITGVVFQVLFKKSLSHIQWMSLIILTLGCIVKEVGHATNAGSDSSSGDDHNHSVSTAVKLSLICTQVICSCVAGVYNEYLLKNTGADCHVMLQNCFMYVDSIVVALVVIMLFPAQSDGATPSSPLSIQEMQKVVSQPSVLVIVLNNAAIGITTSLFLRSLNSILKTFASALELMFTAVLSLAIFGIPIDAYTVASIFVVSCATWLYAKNPVVNKGKLVDAGTAVENGKLMEGGANSSGISEKA